MRAFRRVGDGYSAELEEFEVALLSSLTDQLSRLLGGADDPGDLDELDAFQWLAAAQARRVRLDYRDPLIARLFPAAYRVDDLDAEYRRYTEEDSRRARVDQAAVVLADLTATREGEQPLVVVPQHLDAWLKTVNALRLSLSVRLGIVDEADLDALERLSARDPRTQMVDIYEWLGYLLESLLEAAGS